MHIDGWSLVGFIVAFVLGMLVDQVFICGN